MISAPASNLKSRSQMQPKYERAVVVIHDVQSPRHSWRHTIILYLCVGFFHRQIIRAALLRVLDFHEYCPTKCKRSMKNTWTISHYCFIYSFASRNHFYGQAHAACVSAKMETKSIAFHGRMETIYAKNISEMKLFIPHFFQVKRFHVSPNLQLRVRDFHRHCKHTSATFRQQVKLIINSWMLETRINSSGCKKTTAEGKQ